MKATKSMPQPGSKGWYTKEDVDKCVNTFERSAVKVEANKASAVKLRASERDLLTAAEKLRDLCIKALGGNKDLLNEVFGGDCSLIHRTYAVLERIELSDMHAGDQRWSGLRKQVDGVKQVLEDLGTFKPFAQFSDKPENLLYVNYKHKYSPGERVTLNPSWEGADPTSFRFSDDTPLPPRMRIHAVTGVISGMFQAGLEVPMKQYQVICENISGMATCTLEFSVQYGPPTGIKFVDLPKNAIMYLGEPMAIEPQLTSGMATQWTVTPELPQGLKINYETGRIYGVPRNASPVTEYIVTGMNNAGVAEAVLTLGVDEAPPITLCYPDAQHEYPTDAVLYLLPSVEMKKNRIMQIRSEDKDEDGSGLSGDDASGKDFAPAPRGSAARESQLGGMATTSSARRKSDFSNLLVDRAQGTSVPPGLTFTVTPELPAGLQISEAMGVVTGRPLRPCETKTYKITCSNGGGKAEAEITLTVCEQTPTAITFACGDDKTLKGPHLVGQPLKIQPVADAPIGEWYLEGTLPHGVSFNSSMGIIEGIPARVGDFQCKITGTNASGSCTQEFEFSIVKPPPSDLVCNGVETCYPLLREMTPITPSVTGTVEEWSVKPPLPAGMALDKKTGVIAGTPSRAAPEQTYTLTASNSTGKTSAEMTFAAKLMAPTALSYPSVDETYNHNEDVYLAPKIEGGATHWTITPALPEGMTLNEETGMIRGAPQETREEQTYVVNASNEAGDIACELSFKVDAPPPEGLEYPSVNDVYSVGQPLKIEPTMQSGICGMYNVKPPLPDGLELNKSTGVITGKPTATHAKKTYTVTVANIAGSTKANLSFTVDEAKKSAVAGMTPEEEELANEVELVTDLEELKQKFEARMAQIRGSIPWMVWMVHRVFLNDPDLPVLSFSQMQMPLPHEDPRVSPKLMTALCHNTVLKELHLVNSNMQANQGTGLAAALRENKTLQVMDLECNCLDAQFIQKVCEALGDSSSTSAVQKWCFSGQKTCENFGQRCEEAIAAMVKKNHNIIKLGVPMNEPHWRREVDTALIKNMDSARRARKAAAGKVDDAPTVKAKEVSLGKVILSEVPDKAAYEVFEEDNIKHSVVRKNMAKTMRLPTKEQLQQFARNNGTPLKFAEVAPLLTEFRTKLLDAFVEKQITCHTLNGEEHTGKMSEHSVKNDKWLLDVWPSDEKRFAFKSDKAPVLEVSAEVAEWLGVGDQE